MEDRGQEIHEDTFATAVRHFESYHIAEPLCTLSIGPF